VVGADKPGVERDRARKADTERVEYTAAVKVVVGRLAVGYRVLARGYSALGMPGSVGATPIAAPAGQTGAELKMGLSLARRRKLRAGRECMEVVGAG
jgi:hypothetical protein